MQCTLFVKKIDQILPPGFRRIEVTVYSTVSLVISKNYIFELIWYGPDNPCRAKKNTNNLLIGHFKILPQLCDFFVVFWPFF
jgi:hypothetical protein